MEENKTNKEEFKEVKKPEKHKLSPDGTVLLTVAGVLLGIVVLRLVYWIITGI